MPLKPHDNGNLEDICAEIRASYKAEDVMTAMKQVTETHSIMKTLLSHTAHLPTIAQSNEDIKGYLMGAATGRDHVPVKVVQSIVKIFGWIVFGLTSIIVFSFTGSKFGLFNLH